MSNERFTEDSYEQALIDLFRDMGYDYEYGPDMERDYREPVNKEELRRCLDRLNQIGPIGALSKKEYLEIHNFSMRFWHFGKKCYNSFTSYITI